MRRLCNKSTHLISKYLVNQIDFGKHSLTYAGKGIIDETGHFSFLNTEIPGKFF